MPDTVALWRTQPMRSLMLVGGCSAASVAVTISSVPLRAVGEGIPASSAGLTIAVMLLVTMATQPLVPRLATRADLVFLLVSALLALSATSLFYGATSKLWVFLLIGIVRGCGLGVLTVSGTALSATLTPSNRQSEAQGLYGASTSFPPILCLPAGVALAHARLFGVVWLIALLPLLAVPAALKLGHGRSGLAHSAPERPVQGQMAAIRLALSPAVVLLAAMAAVGGLTTYLPIARYNGQLVTIALLMMGSAAFLGRWRATHVADRYGLRVLTPAASASAAAGTVLIAQGVHGVTNLHSILILSGALLVGAAYGTLQALTIIATVARVQPHQVTVGSAVWNFSIEAGLAGGTVLVGALAATRLALTGAFTVCAVLVAASLPLAVAAGRTNLARRDPREFPEAVSAPRKTGP